MNNSLKVSIAMAMQAAVIFAYFYHMKVSQLGSDFMFGLLMVSILNGLFLFFLSFKKGGLTGWQKISATLFALAPAIFTLSFIYFHTKRHS